MHVAGSLPVGRVASLGDAGAELRQLWQLTFREAQTLSFADAFMAIALCFAIATVMVPLMRKVAAPVAPSADAH